MNKELIMKDKELTEFDTEKTTYGCRHSNPDICSNNGMDNICAFYSKDCLCKKPPKSWKRAYNELKEKK